MLGIPTCGKNAAFACFGIWLHFSMSVTSTYGKNAAFAFFRLMQLRYMAALDCDRNIFNLLPGNIIFYHDILRGKLVEVLDIRV